jgi:hypothetical protein
MSAGLGKHGDIVPLALILVGLAEVYHLQVLDGLIQRFGNVSGGCDYLHIF